MDRINRDTQTLLDRHNKAMAAILKRFLNMTKAATAPIPKENPLEFEALNQMRMETETTGLISEIENLLQINREMKMLWIMGPLRTPGEDEAQQAELDAKARRVRDLYNQVMAQQLERRKAAAEAKVLGKNKPEGTQADGSLGNQ